MNLFQNNKNLFLIYGFFLLWIVFSALLSRIAPSTTVSLITVFFLLIITPGFSLSRIFKLRFNNDLPGQLALWLALGFIFTFSLNLIGIFLGFKIIFLLKLFLVFLSLLLASAFIFDLKRQELENKPLLDWKLNKISSSTLLPTLLVIFCLAILYIVGFQGSLLFGGDPTFHLSIIRKAFDNLALTINNLSYTKSNTIQLTYGLPIWHIFIAMLARLMRLDPINIYGQIAVPLLLAVYLVWYWLLKLILPTKNFVILAFFLFLIFTFAPTGYLARCLVLPDTFNRLLLMPLCFALSLKYIFDKTLSYKFLIILSLLLIFLTIIHENQYFYFMFTMMIMVVIYAITQFRQSSYKETLKRILLSMASNLILFFAFAGVLETHGKVFTSTLKTLLANPDNRKIKYDNFTSWNILSLYTYLFLPFTLIFLKKHRSLIFTLAIILAPFLGYLNILKPIMIRFGYIFLNRLYNLALDYQAMIWALILGFALILIDRLLRPFTRTFTKLRSIINVIFAVAGIFVILKHNNLINLYNKLFSSNAQSWLSDHLSLLFVAMFLITISIVIGMSKSPKLNRFFNLEEPHLIFANFCLIFILLLFFIFSSVSTVKDIFKNSNKSSLYFLSQTDDKKVFENYYSNIFNPEIADFINTNIAAKSIILAPQNQNIILPTLTDQYMAYYPHSSKETFYNDNLFLDIPIGQKISYLKEGKIGYIMDESKSAYWDKYPEYFKKIYQGQYNIYQVKINSN